jgi:tripartite-type tricarboxylate transporter receptor subunit TctC
VPYAAGGGLDTVARNLAEGLSQKLGQTFNIDNRPGGGGMIGADAVAKAAPDGMTLLMAADSELTITPSVAGRAPYSAASDFAPIVLVAQTPNVLVTGASQKAKTLREIVDSARRDKRVLTIGTAGAGTVHHIAVEVLSSSLGIDVTHVPYKGAAPATVAALGGEIDMALVGAPPLMPHLKSGKLLPLAVTQSARSPLLPEVPTVGQAAGVMADVDFVTWFGLLAPARTPPAVLKTLETAALAHLSNADVRTKLNALGIDVVALPGRPFGERLRHDAQMYAEVVKRYRIKAD